MYPKRASTSRMIGMIAISDMSGSSLTMKRRRVAGGQRRQGLPRVKTLSGVGAQTRGAGTAMRRLVSQSNDRSERT